MGVRCCACSKEYDEVITVEGLNARLNLKSMSILDFEKRVKKYAHLKNRGKISIEQLQEAFKDTDMFLNLKNPLSVVNRLLTSPFFSDFVLSHNQMGN